MGCVLVDGTGSPIIGCKLLGGVIQFLVGVGSLSELLPSLCCELSGFYVSVRTLELGPPNGPLRLFGSPDIWCISWIWPSSDLYIVLLAVHVDTYSAVCL